MRFLTFQVFHYSNRNQASESHEQIPHPPSSAESWKQQCFGVESQDNSKTKKNSIDSGVCTALTATHFLSSLIFIGLL